MPNFKEEIEKKLAEQFKSLNPLARPRLQSISLSMRLGRFKDDPKAVAVAKEELTKISGQAPSLRLAKKAISSFKLKAGETVGYLVTLRGQRMWAFLEKLVKVVLPGGRDFRGLNPRSLDQQGNLTIGFKDQTVFPEIDPNKIDRLRGLAVSLLGANLKKDDTLLKFWQSLGFVFRKE